MNFRSLPAMLTLAAAFALAFAGPSTAVAVLDEGAGSAATAGATVPVLAAGTAFVSPVLVVPAGTTVQWDSVLFPHTVTTADGPAEAATGTANDPAGTDGDPDTFNAFVPEGASFSHTFTEAGTFTYYCEIHRAVGMVATVVVV